MIYSTSEDSDQPGHSHNLHGECACNPLICADCCAYTGRSMDKSERKTKNILTAVLGSLKSGLHF